LQPGKWEGRVCIVRSPIRYSICSLVNGKEEYAGMVNSFKQAGFTEPLCEYLYVDNSERNKFDAYEGLNQLITASQGEYIILCHQDIELRFDNLEVLEKRIAELNQLDKNWAILSNAGGYNLKKVFKRITHPGDQFNAGPFPHQVTSVDENFIVIKKSANLSLSRDLSGFHLYGTDLCIIANILGYTAWAIDFHLYHKSTGNMNQSFYDTRKLLTKKYSNAFRSRYIKTTCTNLFISGNSFLSLLMNTSLMITLTKFMLKIRKLVKGDYI
jgi:hypothetical protein